MYRAVSWDSARLGCDSIVVVTPLALRCHRRRNEHALFAAKCAAGLAPIFAAARSMDGARETIYGILAARDPVVSALRARCSARSGRGDLGQLLLAGDCGRVLDEGRV